MSSYIGDARKKLKIWGETMDIDVFSKQYEALNHGTGGVLLEDMMDETEYLKQSKANAIRLDNSIDSYKGGSGSRWHDRDNTAFTIAMDLRKIQEDLAKQIDDKNMMFIATECIKAMSEEQLTEISFAIDKARLSR